MAVAAAMQCTQNANALHGLRYSSFELLSAHHQSATVRRHHTHSSSLMWLIQCWWPSICEMESGGLWGILYTSLLVYFRAGIRWYFVCAYEYMCVSDVLLYHQICLITIVNQVMIKLGFDYKQILRKRWRMKIVDDNFTAQQFPHLNGIGDKSIDDGFLSFKTRACYGFTMIGYSMSYGFELKH